MKKYFAIFSILLVSMVFFFSTTVEASMLGDIMKYGSKFFKENYSEKTNDSFVQGMVGGLDDFVEMIKTIGYTVFFVTGAILGFKYMWSGAEGKAFIKNGLVTYVIGVIFFFTGDKVYSLVSNILLGSVSKQSTYKSLEEKIIGSVNYVVTALAILSLMYVGLKYMFANSSQKASLKSGMVPMVIGAILIVCLTQIINFVIKVADKQLDIKTSIVMYEEYDDSIKNDYYVY